MSHSPIFKDIEYPDVLALAKATGLPTLVYVTASGSVRTSPNIDAAREADVRAKLDEKIDQVTWSAPEVVAGLHGKLVAVQVAANSKAAKSLNVKNPPSIVLFRDGKEVDRVEMMWPPWSPSRLIRWLDGVASGLTHKAQVTAVNEELKARFDKGMELLRDGRAEEALEELIWLWENAEELEPTWVGVRHVGLASALGRVVASNEDARSRVTRLRDTAEARLTNYRMVNDWVTLNGILGDAGRVISWLRSLPLNIASELNIGRNRSIRAVVRELGAWDALGRFIEDPVELLREERTTRGNLASTWKQTSALPPEQLSAFDLVSAESFRNLAVTLHHTLVAVGRHSEAAEIIADAKRIDPSPEMEAALAAGKIGATKRSPAKKKTKKK